MATFLTGVQDLAEDCSLPSLPTSVTGQVGMFKKLVKWYKDAWIEIQNRHNGQWRWMRHEFTVNTAADDDTYAFGDCTDSTTSSAITRFARWRFEDPLDPPKIYLQSAGVGTQNWLIWVPWEWFKTVYRIGQQSINTGYPAHITIDPQNNIVLGPKPNGIYVVTGDYYRSAQILSANSDVPEMPSQYHKLITYVAMQKYGYKEAAAEVLAEGSAGELKLMRQLENNQLPVPSLDGPMA